MMRHRGQLVQTAVKILHVGVPPGPFSKTTTMQRILCKLKRIIANEIFGPKFQRIQNMTSSSLENIFFREEKNFLKALNSHSTFSFQGISRGRWKTQTTFCSKGSLPPSFSLLSYFKQQIVNRRSASNLFLDLDRVALVSEATTKQHHERANLTIDFQIRTHDRVLLICAP